MRTDRDIENAISRHGDTVWRACSLYFHNKADMEDAFQDTFLKYSTNDRHFENDEHLKAWLIRVAQNVCKDMLRAQKRHATPYDVEVFEESTENGDSQPSPSKMDIVNAMRSLDDPPKTPLYLSIYEGYSADEIARMLDAPVGTVYSWISRGKKLMREALS